MRFSTPRLTIALATIALGGLTVFAQTPPAPTPCVTSIPGLSDAPVMLSHIDDILNDALQSVAPGPWPDEGPVTMEVAAFARLPEEVGLRLLGRVIQWTGNEGPVELAKLEALYASLAVSIDAALDGVNPRRFRRTLAGAMITLSGTKLTVERAPSRRTGAKSRQSDPKPLSPKTPFTKAR